MFASRFKKKASTRNNFVAYAHEEPKADQDQVLS